MPHEPAGRPQTPGESRDGVGGRFAPTVASWFSGGGGLDIGLERAGWTVVSHSEIDPYACALLEQRWPGVPNLGDIAKLDSAGGVRHLRLGEQPRDDGRHDGPRAGGRDAWHRADLWAGGPPCQDFSVAGKRAGLGGARSSLAVTWFDLVGRHRPGALLFENVPGILSSRRGLDWYALLRTLGDLGYWWAYRVLNASEFGVPQRRRRVWLLALDADRHPDPDGPAQVLAVGTRCGRDHAAEREAWAAAAGRAGDGVAGTLDAHHGRKWGSHQWTDPGKRFLVVDRAATDPGGVREAPGMAGRLDDSPRVGAFVKAQRAHHSEDHERWEDGTVSPALDAAGQTPRTAMAVVQSLDTKRGGPDDNEAQAGHIVTGRTGDEDPLLPAGLDSHRYRVIGNGVASPQSEWIGRRLLAYLSAAQEQERAA